MSHYSNANYTYVMFLLKSLFKLYIYYKIIISKFSNDITCIFVIKKCIIIGSDYYIIMDVENV